MVSKEIKLLAQFAVFNKYVRECRHHTTELKTWANYKTFLHQAHSEQMIAVTTTGKVGYTAAVQNIYGVPPPPPEEHHEGIDNLNNIFQEMKTQSYDLEGMAQTNTILNRYNSMVMVELAQMTVTIPP